MRQALDEAQWLVDNNPTIPHFARSRALILAKLGAVCLEAGRAKEAAAWFEQALHAQSALVERFPSVPAHDRVLVEFFRYRLAAICLGLVDSPGCVCDAPTAMLQTCVTNLTGLLAQRELADDRVAVNTLKLAKDALDGVRAL